MPDFRIKSTYITDFRPLHTDFCHSGDCSISVYCVISKIPQWGILLITQYPEMEMMSFLWNFHHWLHRKLSKWQLSVQPVTKYFNKTTTYLFQCNWYIPFKTNYFSSLFINVSELGAWVFEKLCFFRQFWLCGLKLVHHTRYGRYHFHREISIGFFSRLVWFLPQLVGYLPSKKA